MKKYLIEIDLETNFNLITKPEGFFNINDIRLIIALLEELKIGLVNKIVNSGKNMNKIIKVNDKDINIFYEGKNNVDRFVKEVITDEEYSAAFKHKTIIDVGANIGTFSLYAYEYADIIYAIEPLKINYDNLVKTIQENKLDKIKPFHLAISEKTCRKYLTSFENDYANTQVTDEHTGEEVDAVSLAEFIKQNNINYIDVLKVDTEAHETTIFGAPDFKDIAHIIDVIIYEHGGTTADYWKSLGFELSQYKNLFLCKRI